MLIFLKGCFLEESGHDICVRPDSSIVLSKKGKDVFRLTLKIKNSRITISYHTFAYLVVYKIKMSWNALNTMKFNKNFDSSF